MGSPLIGAIRRIAVTVAMALWWLPAVLLDLAGLIGAEIQAHARIARASRMYRRAERLAEAGRIDRAQALLDRGDALLELAKPKPRDPT